MMKGNSENHLEHLTSLLIALRLASKGGRRLEKQLVSYLINQEMQQVLDLEQAVPDSFRVDADRVLHRCTELCLKVIPFSAPDYPERLRQIPDPPGLLFVAGGLRPEYHTLDCLGVGIVGTRRASAYGKRVAAEISAELTSRGGFVVSGLALGVDGAAHAGAVEKVRELASISTNTLAGIAVLGCGLGQIYPASHRQLARALREAGGVIISEYLPDDRGFPQNFLERNRLISGLSDLTIVVEAPERSGALSTVRHALEQGREVMSVPGNIDSELSRGSNQLIRGGCAVFTTVADIFELNTQFGERLHEPLTAIPPDTPPPLLQLIHSRGKISLEEISLTLGLPPEQIRQQLTLLELENKLHFHYDGHYSTREFIDTIGR